MTVCVVSTSDHLCVSESLDEQALKILVDAGLQKRFTPECDRWMYESATVPALCNQMRDDELQKLMVKWDKENKSLIAGVHEGVVEEVLRLYPYVLSFSLFQPIHPLDSFLEKRAFANPVEAFIAAPGKGKHASRML